MYTGPLDDFLKRIDMTQLNDRGTLPPAPTTADTAIQTVPEEKRSYMWLYILLLVIIIAIGVWFIWFKK